MTLDDTAKRAQESPRAVALVLPGGAGNRFFAAMIAIVLLSVADYRLNELRALFTSLPK
jgi:hypothetical protein